ncbi:hypothetical protein BGZ60DRAFT_474253 [Tricladium varicosporioides]|nr:hypothetical protein BGZ60DRAFT_474253 [Hymenoscyphus varicosporioides]
MLNPEADTTALDDSFLETVTIHNREYQQYSIENLVYFVPVDDDEIERLLTMHNVLTRAFDNRLIFPPLPRPRRILDCGHGSASWAIAVAAEYPRCEEPLGSGISNSYADNNNGLTFPSHNFDLVHSQMVANGIHVNRWTNYTRDMFRVTRPGGWCQMVELYYNVQSDNGSLTEGHALRQWSSRYLESHEGLKDLRVPLRLPALMREAGFVDVEHQMIPLHTCAWSSDQRLSAIGAVHRESVQSFLSSMAIYPFTERLGMTIQDAHLLIAQARIEADNPAFKAYFPLYVCIGRKSRSRR